MGGHRPGRGGTRVLEDRAARRECIQNRRGGSVVAIHTQVIGPQGIEGDQEDERSTGRWMRWLGSVLGLLEAATSKGSGEQDRGRKGKGACGHPIRGEGQIPHGAILAAGLRARKPEEGILCSRAGEIPPGRYGISPEILDPPAVWGINSGVGLSQRIGGSGDTLFSES